jgi:hypothetical protein
LKQLYPTYSPERLKQLLINNAETDIGQPAQADQVIPNIPAPISRIGGGEVRVDRAAKATSGAYGFDLVKTGTRGGGVSFGFVDVADQGALVHRRVRVFNTSKQPAIFKVKPTYLYQDDVATGAVKIHALPLIAVPAKGDTTIDVYMTIDGTKLRNNLMNAGADGPNPIPLTVQEYDGYLVFDKVALFGKPETFTLPWHVLPRKAANTQATTGPTARSR